MPSDPGGGREAASAHQPSLLEASHDVTRQLPPSAAVQMDSTTSTFKRPRSPLGDVPSSEPKHHHGSPPTPDPILPLTTPPAIQPSALGPTDHLTPPPPGEPLDDPGHTPTLPFPNNPDPTGKPPLVVCLSYDHTRCFIHPSKVAHALHGSIFQKKSDRGDPADHTRGPQFSPRRHPASNVLPLLPHTIHVPAP
ncbi:uncharacterized protein LOC127004712 [Eriocheir sinensis]|uniref:uncharacterized protein LOC127004712 n=1 Tax=Eriocheir sinensis TaxID=95602 RepID=UPI0021C9ADA9|nr:uncharacterized protein LOC127004712 [Eriocheir sinensis]